MHRKTTAYHLQTKVISNLMLFIKLTGGPFLQGQFFKFAEFWVFRILDFQTASTGVCWTSQFCVVTKDGPNEAGGFGRLSALTSKRRRFILAYSSRTKFGRTFGTRLHELRYKIISQWERHICLSKPKTVPDSFRWVCMVHLWTKCVLHVIW